MNHIRVRAAAASSFLVLAGLAAAPAASAGPMMIPRHQAPALVAPDPGPALSGSSTSGCGAGRFAVNCAVPAGAPVPVRVPMAAQHALDAEAGAAAVPGAAVPVPARVPMAAQHALDAEAGAAAVPSTVAAAGQVHVPAGAEHAMAGDMADAPLPPVLPARVPKRY
jgi:hypothetical protein